MLLMIALYGIVLGFAAKTIADGSELLLELFPNSSSIIGGLLLPVLGAVPDSAMILVSGVGGTPQQAQTQLGVGVGTLAGSTIMLLTIPWTASILVGRSDIVDGHIIKKKLSHNNLFSGKFWTATGVEVDQDTSINSMIAWAASGSFLLVQVTAFAFLRNAEGAEAKQIEGIMALIGLIICFLGFALYCGYQVIVPTLAQKRQDKAEKNREERNLYLKAMMVVKQLKKQTLPLNYSKKYSIQASRPRGSSASAPASSSTGSILEKNPKRAEDENHMIALMYAKKWKAKAIKYRSMIESGEITENSPLLKKGYHHDDDDDEEEGDNDDEQQEEPQESFSITLAKSLGYMTIGLTLVAVFSDPMVDVLSKLGAFLSVPPFYISFIITPLCSNASELIASIVFASKKTVVSSSMTFSQLYGAATMNATLGLGIFYTLIYARDLAWEFSAETMAILLVTWLVCGLGSFFQVYETYWVLPNSLLFPFSLVVVYLLEVF